MLRQKILFAIEKNGGIASTLEILEIVFSDNINVINQKINDELLDERTKKEYKRKKEKLERKLLYHLNKLLSEGKIKEIGKKQNGEKVFSLNSLNSKETTYETPINSSYEVAFSLREFEEKKIVHLYSKEDILRRVSAVLINGKHIEHEKVFQSLMRYTPHLVNDVIGINNFENVLMLSTPKRIVSTLLEVSKEFNTYISTSIEPLEIDEETLYQFLEKIGESNTEKIEVIIRVNKEKLIEYRDVITTIASILRGKEPKFNVHLYSNNNQHKDKGLIIGKAGVYGVDNAMKDLDEYPLLIIGGMNTIIDLQNIPEKNIYSIFREASNKIAKSIIKMYTHQVTNYTKFYSTPQIASFIKNRKINEYTTHFIRIWNYNWKAKEIENFLQLLNSTKKEIESFARSQEIILKAAGMPLPLKIKFHSCFGRSSKEISKRVYPKKSIKVMKDLLSEESKKYISIRERISNIFGISDRYRIFQPILPDEEEVYREIVLLSNTTNLDLISFDFGKRKGDLSLKYFLGSISEKDNR